MHECEVFCMLKYAPRYDAVWGELKNSSSLSQPSALCGTEWLASLLGRLTPVRVWIEDWVGLVALAKCWHLSEIETDSVVFHPLVWSLY